MWARDDYPTWSLPALEAAKCVALQGNDAFERVHLLLFEAFFSKGINIGTREEVIEVVRGAGVEMNRFFKDYEAGTARSQVMQEYEEALTTYRVNSVPTVIFDGNQRVIGATPIEEYLKILAAQGVS